MQLNEMKIIVTGAARGMGAYFATKLHEAGAKVAAGDIDEAALAELPKGVATRKLDVSKEEDCISFVSWANEQMGGLTGLINNAGIIRDGLLIKKDRETGAIKKMAADQWQSVIDVNLTGATLMVRETLATMVEAGSKGVVVNISSVSRSGNRGQSNYVATKAAMSANTLTWAREWAKFGIRSTCIAPGMIETPMTKGMNQKARDALVASVPSRRIGDPEDIWRAVQFCIECDYFNGRTVEVDGGLVMT